MHSGPESALSRGSQYPNGQEWGSAHLPTSEFRLRQGEAFAAYVNDRWATLVPSSDEPPVCEGISNSKLHAWAYALACRAIHRDSDRLPHRAPICVTKVALARNVDGSFDILARAVNGQTGNTILITAGGAVKREMPPGHEAAVLLQAKSRGGDLDFANDWRLKVVPLVSQEYLDLLVTQLCQGEFQGPLGQEVRRASERRGRRRSRIVQACLAMRGPDSASPRGFKVTFSDGAVCFGTLRSTGLLGAVERDLTFMGQRSEYMTRPRQERRDSRGSLEKQLAPLLANIFARSAPLPPGVKIDMHLAPIEARLTPPGRVWRENWRLSADPLVRVEYEGGSGTVIRAQIQDIDSTHILPSPNGRAYVTSSQYSGLLLCVTDQVPHQYAVLGYILDQDTMDTALEQLVGMPNKGVFTPDVKECIVRDLKERGLVSDISTGDLDIWAARACLHASGKSQDRYRVVCRHKFGEHLIELTRLLPGGLVLAADMKALQFFADPEAIQAPKG